MASIRSEIKTLVNYNTQRTDKTTLIELLCDMALKTAINKHNFEPAYSVTTETCVVDQDYVSLPSGLISMISVRVRDSNNQRNWPLIIKGTLWWDERIGTPADSNSGEPAYGFIDITSNKLYLYRVPDSTDLQIIMRAATYPAFASDSVENPIPVLDLWIVSWVTSQVFKSLEQFDRAAQWKFKAQEDMLDAQRTNKRHPAKERKREERLVGASSNHPLGSVIRTTGDLGNRTWR